jgi:hypothetical protein
MLSWVGVTFSSFLRKFSSLNELADAEAVVVFDDERDDIFVTVFVPIDVVVVADIVCNFFKIDLVSFLFF